MQHLGVTNIPWRFVMGGCRICRPSGRNVVNAGRWDRVDLAYPEDESKYVLLPTQIGILRKATDA